MSRREQLLKLMRERFPEETSLRSLREMTTWKTGGSAVVVDAASMEMLSSILSVAVSEGFQWTVLGMGSNVLAPDHGCERLIIRLSGDFRGSLWTESGDCMGLRCGGGVHLPSISVNACTRGASGFGFAVGIPGTVGGAVFMNAGAYGSCMADLIRSVTVLDYSGSVRIVEPGDCGFDYRTSRFQNDGSIIAEAEFLFRKGDPGELRSQARRTLQMRREKFPLEYPNAGSVFRRPDQGIPPGKLIQDAGLKGETVGGAMVSVKHANFIINTGEALSADIAQLVRLVKDRVFESSGIMLHEEIRYLCEGEGDDAFH